MVRSYTLRKVSKGCTQRLPLAEGAELAALSLSKDMLLTNIFVSHIEFRPAALLASECCALPIL